MAIVTKKDIEALKLEISQNEMNKDQTVQVYILINSGLTDSEASFMLLLRVRVVVCFRKGFQCQTFIFISLGSRVNTAVGLH